MDGKCLKFVNAVNLSSSSHATLSIERIQEMLAYSIGSNKDYASGEHTTTIYWLLNHKKINSFKS